jgi:hypothetical protein
VVLLSLPLLSLLLLLLLYLLFVLLQSNFALLLLSLLLLLLLFGKLYFFAFPLFYLLVGHLGFFLLLFPHLLHDFRVLLQHLDFLVFFPFQLLALTQHFILLLLLLFLDELLRLAHKLLHDLLFPLLNFRQFLDD